MLSPVMRCIYFSYHYKLLFDAYAYTFDMCTNNVYLLTYLLTYFYSNKHCTHTEVLNFSLSERQWQMTTHKQILPPRTELDQVTEICTKLSNVLHMVETILLRQFFPNITHHSTFIYTVLCGMIKAHNLKICTTAHRQLIVKRMAVTIHQCFRYRMIDNLPTTNTASDVLSSLCRACN